MISIIVPVYNVKEEYLSRSISSLLSQTYNDIEIIIIDDGSTKQTANYCDFLSGTDKRITVFHKKNEGVSKARNIGTQLAKGDYIFYMDSDDILFPYALEEGMHFINTQGSDIIIGAVMKIEPTNIFSLDKVDFSQIVVDDYDLDNMDDLRNHFMLASGNKYRRIRQKGYIGRNPTCRLIRSNIAKEICFPEDLPLGEDVCWNMELTRRAKKISLVHDIWYGYVIYDKSSMRKYYGNRKELIEAYINKLVSNNKTYFDNHRNELARNVAMEFYCVLKYEFMSDSCPLTKIEKNRIVSNMLRNDPWNILIQKRHELSYKYKALLLLCKYNIWQNLI